MEHIDTLNRIDKLFQRKSSNILSVFYTAGYPQLDDTVRIGKLLAEAGADLIEIGIPFSDPIADGPVIQASNKQALKNGIHLNLLLNQVKELREQTDIPILLMGYLNPVMQYSLDKFFDDATIAGVDGLIIPDLPLDEYNGTYKEKLEALGLSMVFLVTPSTSEERIRKIDASSSGFVYAVSASATTGARNDFSDAQLDYFKKLKNYHLKNPLLVGFGVSNAKTFSKACQYAHGAIVGSSFIRLLSESQNLEVDIRNFVKELKSSVNT